MDTATLIDRYCRAWSDRQAADRRQTIAAVDPGVRRDDRYSYRASG